MRSHATWNRLWLLDHLLDRPRVDRWFPRLRAKATERVARAIEPSPPLSPEDFSDAFAPVERRQGLSRDVFIRDYVRRDTPVILAGAASGWSAAQRWTFPFFIDTYGELPIQLINAAAGDDSGDRAGPRRPLGEVLTEAMGGSRVYPRFVPLHHLFPELRHDLDMPWLAAMRGPWLERLGLTLQLFLGGPGSTTALHSALSSNLFVQLQGRKRWLILSTDWGPALDVALNRSPYFFSDVDLERPDFERFPFLPHVRGWVADLEPGDVLYNPPFYWHQVRNLDLSVAVGFRYYDPVAMLRASRIMTALTFLASEPPVWKAAQLKGDFSKIFSGAWRG